jgi:ligand-binding sensor domain-containing protein/DNA-binding CsgD family transcriptional regulator
MFRLQLCLFLTFAVLSANAQLTLGLPEIVNYSKQAYRGGAQTRRVVQDATGLLYFANDEGVLRFDGARWRSFPLPNRSLVRCLQFGPDGQLYVGGQDEIGFFAPTADGSMKFQSLKHLLPANSRSLTDVWEIYFAGNDLFFQTSTSIYRISGKQVTVYRDEHWRFMGSYNGAIIAQSKQRGLLQFSGQGWQPWEATNNTKFPPDFTATSLLEIGKDNAVLTTLRNGIYFLKQNKLAIWQTPDLLKIGQQNISYACVVNNEQIALGTSLNGCYIIDKGGNLVQHISRKEGLQDNSILTVFLDSRQNLWLGLHNGIDFIPYNNAITHFGIGPLNEGAGYSSQLFDDQLYLGTSIGLFRVSAADRIKLRSSRAEVFAVPNSAGDAWNLSKVNGQLLLGHNEGAFLVEDQTLKPIDRSVGYWTFISVPGKPNLVTAGSYKGVSFFKTDNRSIIKEETEAEIESARFVVPAFGKIWFSHPYKGIYAVWQKPDGSTSYKKYGPEEGVTSINNNYLFWIKDQLLLTTDNGVFVFRPGSNRFEPSPFFNKHLPSVPIRYLKEDNEGNVWFVFEKKIGVLDLSNTKPKLIYFPELTNKFVAGFEHINPLDQNNVLIGGEKGFYHIDYAKYKTLQHPLHVRISAIQSIGQSDTLLFGGYSKTIREGISNTFAEQSLEPTYNSLRFEFTAPVYGQLSNVEYSYWLEGFDKSWSAFESKTEKEYTNLPPGDYIFKIKARNNLGNESAVQSYVFTILPPWYQTGWAYLIYTLTFAILLYQLYRFLRRKFKAQQLRHEEEQRNLLYLHQLEMDKAEKELIALRNAKLEAELIVKNTELASAALHLVQKSDVLQKIKEQMSKLKQNAPIVGNGTDLKKILKTLNEENKIEEQWHHFSQHFDVVHHDFLSKLRSKYPALTPNDQKLCAYLKMNLSTKEIAQLMNITPRGVEISRYRLRKKMEVPQGMHLFNFLDSVNE